MAYRLPKAATLTSHDPNMYMVELDVFHQLHGLSPMLKVVFSNVFKIDHGSSS
ncbi:hypothetical protein V8C44DRAFT_90498 [Trichoderma aethiopicum]